MIRVRVDDIAAAHHLPGYAGNCARPHGHNWSFEATVGAEHLHEDMVVDFRLLKDIFKQLDHTDLNDDPQLVAGGRRPTAEHLAEVIAARLQHALADLPNHPHLLQVVVRETAHNEVVYTP